MNTVVVTFTHRRVIVHLQCEHECSTSTCSDTCTREMDVIHLAGTLSNPSTAVSSFPLSILSFSGESFIVREAEVGEWVDVVVGTQHLVLYEGPTCDRAQAEHFLSDENFAEAWSR